MKIIIAFSRESQIPLLRAVCRKFRHCAVILPCDGQRIMIQLGVDGVRLIRMSAKMFRVLKQNGWEFVECESGSLGMSGATVCRGGIFGILNCVGFAKRVIGIRDPFIQTPDALFKRIRKRKSVRLPLHFDAKMRTDVI